MARGDFQGAVWGVAAMGVGVGVARTWLVQEQLLGSCQRGVPAQTAVGGRQGGAGAEGVPRMRETLLEVRQGLLPGSLKLEAEVAGRWELLGLWLAFSLLDLEGLDTAASKVGLASGQVHCPLQNCCPAMKVTSRSICLSQEAILQSQVGKYSAHVMMGKASAQCLCC